MGLGQNIKKFRIQRGMTQKVLGVALGFKESNADIRIAQYENCSRSPRNGLVLQIADVLDISPAELTISENEEQLLISLDELTCLCKRALSEIGEMKESVINHMKGTTEYE